jgi:hypothetical protein
MFCLFMLDLPEVTVLLSREHFQGNKRMMMLTTHDLFLTSTLHIIHYSGHNPLQGDRKGPTYLESRCLAHGGKSSSTLFPCLVSTAFPLLSNLPSPPPAPWPILYYNNDINNFSLLDLEQ